MHGMNVSEHMGYLIDRLQMVAWHRHAGSADGGDMQGDSMTKQELEHFKEHVSAALGIGSPDSCVYNFLPEDVQEAGRYCLPLRLYCRSSIPAPLTKQFPLQQSRWLANNFLLGCCREVCFVRYAAPVWDVILSKPPRRPPSHRHTPPQQARSQADQHRHWGAVC